MLAASDDPGLGYWSSWKCRSSWGTKCGNLEVYMPAMSAETLFQHDCYRLPEVRGSEAQYSVEVKVQTSFSNNVPSYWLAPLELSLLQVAIAARMTNCPC